MRGPKPSQLELDPPVIRNEGEWLREAEHLADVLAVVDGLRDDMSTEVSKRRKEIKAREREVSNLARALREGRGNRKQTDLFQGEAQRALAQVHAKAEGNPPPTTDAHVFVSKADGVDECHTCGSNAADPVHVGTVEPAEMAGKGKATEARTHASKARTRPKGPLSRKRPGARA